MPPTIQEPNVRLESSSARFILHFVRKISGFARPFALTVLIVAAALKAHQLSTSPFIGNLFFHSRWFAILEVQVELFIAAWLASGWLPSFARRFTVLLFVGFLVATVGKIIAGKNSCGCFGIVEISPWITLLLDAFVIAGLLLSTDSVHCIRTQTDFARQPKCISPGSVNANLGEKAIRWQRRLTFCIVFSMPILLIPIFRMNPVKLSDAGQTIDGGIIVLEPDPWLGKPFPLMDYISCSEQLTKARWKIVLYREDCENCEAEIARAIMHGSLDDMPTAFLEIPPFMSPERIWTRDVIWCRLVDKHQWFVETPTTILIEKGIVIQVLPFENPDLP